MVYTDRPRNGSVLISSSWSRSENLETISWSQLDKFSKTKTVSVKQETYFHNRGDHLLHYMSISFLFSCKVEVVNLI